MRIAFVSTILEYPWGGADTLWTKAAEAAVARGDSLFISVSSAVARSPRIAALATRGALLHERMSPAPRPTLVQRLVHKLQPHRHSDGLVSALAGFLPDLVIVSLGGTYDLAFHPDWLAWLEKSSTPYRLIANWQAENPFLEPADYTLARQAVSRADQLYFVSTRNLAVTRRHLLMPLPQARVIHNPLRWTSADVAPWPTASLRRLAVVSRLHQSKGIHLLLHALATLPDRLIWRLNIYGRGPAEPTLREAVRYLGLGSCVDFRGHVDDLRSIWAENHLLISPSLEDGVPMTIPEAMLCERPVLATAVGGAEDWIDDQKTGFTCAAPTLPLLAAALADSLAAAGRWPAMGKSAAAAALARYRADDYLVLLSPPSVSP